MKKSTLSTLLVGGLIAPTAMIGLTARGADAAAFFQIDDFNTARGGAQIGTNQGDFSTIGTNGGTQVFEVTAGNGTPIINNLGNYRKLSLTSVSGFDNGISSFTVGPASPTSLSWSNPANVQTSASVLWDANGAGLNFNAAPFAGIGIDILSVDLNTSVQFVLSDGTNTTSLALSGLNAGNAFFAFDNFTNSSSFNFGNITSITMNLTGPADVDASFDALGFVAVPEPGTVGGLLVLGLLGAAGAKKSSRKAEQN
ncbi:PEP-CTERM sorting domain-containing protein [Cyanobacterium stanieri LEGE 03274]|uniref:PEP-CTERM sorting domain-containing protein n=1 Tax=Cyanobacterium stanieri LEGE 03274 TaxID=1828756 RepID=A0ABR9V3J0_9CHRO|nr:PEP-CTERM sorting domain-containing protein [Cyanobacterium stanieri]MBE9222461.1 PEP-CTERM sorting domain-containing protein [Cyanobacterium stanieri LEGE 03274]